MPIPNYTPFEELVERYPIVTRFNWDIKFCALMVDFEFIDFIIDEEKGQILYHEESFLKMVQYLENLETLKKNRQGNKEQLN